jgi:hypothetical protein
MLETISTWLPHYLNLTPTVPCLRLGCRLMQYISIFLLNIDLSFINISIFGFLICKIWCSRYYWYIFFLYWFFQDHISLFEICPKCTYSVIASNCCLLEIWNNNSCFWQNCKCRCCLNVTLVVYYIH